MYKLFSHKFYNLYDDAYKNNELLMKYKHGVLWIENAYTKIDKYLQENSGHCILFGSRAVEYAIRANRNTNTFKMQTNDYDVYSSRPKKTIIDIYNILKLDKNVWHANCTFARNRGTCTLFINEIKIIDVTYLAQSLLDTYPIRYTSKGIKYIGHVLLLSAYTGILSDTESGYIIPKTLTKLRLLCDEYHFRMHIDTNMGNVYSSDNKLCNLIVTINKIINQKYDKTIQLIDYYNTLVRIQKEQTSLDLFDDENNNKLERIIPSIDNELEVTHSQTGLPSLYRQSIPSIHRYFYTGSIAAYVYIDAFGGTISNYTKDMLISSIFSSDIELYVENVDYFIYIIQKVLRDSVTTLTLSLFDPIEFPCMFTRAVLIRIDNKYNIILYELTHERFIEIVDFRLPSMNANMRINCSCYTFLLSHLLWQMSKHSKSTNSDLNLKYSNIISVLSIICNNNIDTIRNGRLSRVPSVFRPHVSLFSYNNVGNSRSMRKTNEYIENANESSSNRVNSTESNVNDDDTIINIKYDKFILTD